MSHRRPAVLQRQEPAVHIEDCDVRRGRTSPPDDCAQTPVTWRRTQSSITKYVPVTKRSPHPRHLPTSRGPTPLERAEQQARHTEDAPLGPRTAPLGSALSPKGASSWFSRSGPPHAHPCIRQGCYPRTRQGHHPAHVRSSAYAPGEVPAPTHQAASLPVPRSPRASSPAPLRFPASLKERRADIGQHPQAH